ncbi:MAG: DNA replication/repair protein RecF [Mesorhizobium sp.]
MSSTATPRQPDDVHIERLRLTNFRNYASADIGLRPGLVVLTGENGAGKTNLLEAVSLLTPGRGLRRGNYADMAGKGSASGFAVHASLDGSTGDCEIGTGAGSGDGEGGGRKARINGANVSIDELMERLRVVWLTPAMDALFTGAAGDRRRYIDRLVLAIDPAHGRRALDYEKAMRGRNRLLAEERSDPAWLAAIEAQMAETGVAIAAARMELLQLMRAMVERLPDESPFPKADLDLDGEIERQVTGAAAVDVEQAFAARLAAERRRDRAAGRTLTGPHRTDLLVRHRPKDMAAEFCSTGEQKALLIGMTLAHSRLTADVSGMTPILLLDEIAAHLDEGRRAALFGILNDAGHQTLMTGTDAALFSAISGQAQFLTVSHGSVSDH